MSKHTIWVYGNGSTKRIKPVLRSTIETVDGKYFKLVFNDC